MLTSVLPLPVRTPATEAQQAAAKAWFESLRDRICAAFEAIEDELGGDAPAGRFVQKPWLRDAATSPVRWNEALPPEQQVSKQGSEPGSGGGGVISLMKGRVFEKVGVNVSTVWGAFSEEFRRQMPGAETDGKFWASGISLVAHMRSPRVPAVHMNTRHIATSFGWFGGGADLNPMQEVAEDTAFFHAALKQACDRFDPGYYEAFKGWCDRYFFIPHRGEARGVGGIFYDQLDSGDWARDLAFTQAVGEAFLEVYPQLVRKRMFESWTAEERHHQLVKRGRYAEFNLLYDRGTVFGLKTGGNVEGILMSLPPEAVWE